MEVKDGIKVKTKRYKKIQVFQGQRQGGQLFQHVGLQDTAKIGRHHQTSRQPGYGSINLLGLQIGVDLLYKGLDTDQNRGTLKTHHLDLQQPTTPWCSVCSLSLSRSLSSLCAVYTYNYPCVYVCVCVCLFTYSIMLFPHTHIYIYIQSPLILFIYL